MALMEVVKLYLGKLLTTLLSNLNLFAFSEIFRKAIGYILLSATP